MAGVDHMMVLSQGTSGKGERTKTMLNWLTASVRSIGRFDVKNNTIKKL
jgi:hypothetical protein